MTLSVVTECACSEVLNNEPTIKGSLSLPCERLEPKPKRDDVHTVGSLYRCRASSHAHH
jgi:hypothetical protein